MLLLLVLLLLVLPLLLQTPFSKHSRNGKTPPNFVRFGNEAKHHLISCRKRRKSSCNNSPRRLERPFGNPKNQILTAAAGAAADGCCCCRCCCYCYHQVYVPALCPMPLAVCYVPALCPIPLLLLLVVVVVVVQVLVLVVVVAVLLLLLLSKEAAAPTGCWLLPAACWLPAAGLLTG